MSLCQLQIVNWTSLTLLSFPNAWTETHHVHFIWQLSSSHPFTWLTRLMDLLMLWRFTTEGQNAIQIILAVNRNNSRLKAHHPLPGGFGFVDSKIPLQRPKHPQKYLHTLVSLTGLWLKWGYPSLAITATCFKCMYGRCNNEGDSF